MPPPETDAGLPPPPPGLDVVDTHHDIARDIGQQVEAMILDATQQILEKNGKFVEDYRSRECLVVSIVNDSKCMVLGLGMFWGLEVWSTCDRGTVGWIGDCWRFQAKGTISGVQMLLNYFSMFQYSNYVSRLDGACAILCPDLVFLSV